MYGNRFHLYYLTNDITTISNYTLVCHLTMNLVATLPIILKCPACFLFDY